MTSALAELRVTAEACTSCRLADTRTHVVFGSGTVDSELMFVGEAPGQNEDLQGEPFVGRAGQLLNDLLDEVSIPREVVYIANVIKCRPPGNRDPQQDEIDECKGYLREQIRIVRPRVVVTLGNFATKLLLRTETGITRMRGQVYPWWLGISLIPTFHPAAALRGRESVREAMRQDFRLMRIELDAPSQAEGISAGESDDSGAPNDPAPEVTSAPEEQPTLWG